MELRPDGSRLLWLRGGTSPEVWRTTLDYSTDAVTWTSLGAGPRIPGAWQWPEVAVPTNALVRARGFVAGSGISEWFVESFLATFPQTAPLILTGDGSLGVSSNRFGFNISGVDGQVVVIEGSSNLVNWTSLETNALSNGRLYFSDPAWLQLPARFYQELIANAIHYNSPRGPMPFIKVSCASLSEGIIECVLFRHEKGAFTGAIASRKGRFELAHQGTLFLDEVEDIPPATQIKLLRVLQEGEFERVGGNKTIKVNIRIIAASNRDLQEAVKRGAFREDLYYRLRVIEIEVPPLRARKEDILHLARHFSRQFARKL